MRRALALSDDQMRRVERAARGLKVEARDGFLKTVADHLSGDPSDAAVNAAVNIALDRLALFFCASAAKKETTP